MSETSESESEYSDDSTMYEAAGIRKPSSTRSPPAPRDEPYDLRQRRPSHEHNLRVTPARVESRGPYMYRPAGMDEAADAPAPKVGTSFSHSLGEEYEHPVLKAANQTLQTVAHQQAKAE